jgi:hypothetical protein
MGQSELRSIESSLMEAPVIGRDMNAGAAYYPTIHQCTMALRFILGRLAECSWLELRIIRKLALVRYLYFVLGEICFTEVRTLLKHHHAEAVGRKLFGYYPTCRTRADDDEVDFVRSRTSVEMIEKYYAAHFKTNLDAAAINIMRPKPKKETKSVNDAKAAATSDP